MANCSQETSLEPQHALYEGSPPDEALRKSALNPHRKGSRLARRRLRDRATSRPTAGRKPGSVPFCKDKMRFELAVVLAATTFGNMDTRRAADFAVVFFNPDLALNPNSQRPLELRTTNDGRLIVSAYRAGFQNRSDRIFRKINSMFAAMIEPGNKAGVWYLTSAFCFYRWLNKDPNPAVWLMLCHLGWEDTLTRHMHRRFLVVESPVAAKQ